jgi:hypothetical protein
MSSQATVVETDIHRLAQRQKMIDYGKNTLAYANYIKNVPRPKRQANQSLARCPVTPRKEQITSKRGFDGQVRVWRRLLHEYWNPNDGKEARKAQGLPPLVIELPPASDGQDIPLDSVNVKGEKPAPSNPWDEEDDDLEEALKLAKSIT